MVSTGTALEITLLHRAGKTPTQIPFKYQERLKDTAISFKRPCTIMLPTND